MKYIAYCAVIILVLSSCNDQVKQEPNTPVIEKLPTVKTPEEDLGKFGFKDGIIPKDNPLKNAEQLVITIAPNDESMQGVLFQFDKKDGNWVQHEKTMQVSIGKNGMAWGKGEMDQRVMRGYRRQEGDYKAPAGIFSFGTAFGYAPASEADFIKLPYVQSTDTHFCVDDVNSEYYNSIVTTDEVNKDWDSSEDMLRKDGLYEWGVFVNHNTPAESGDGSCILIHVWRAQGKYTAGCTAGSKVNIQKLLGWLDPEKKPRLVQITKNEYPQMKEWFGLPDLPL